MSSNYEVKIYREEDSSAAEVAFGFFHENAQLNFFQSFVSTSQFFGQQRAVSYKYGWNPEDSGVLQGSFVSILISNSDFASNIHELTPPTSILSSEFSLLYDSTQAPNLLTGCSSVDNLRFGVGFWFPFDESSNTVSNIGLVNTSFMNNGLALGTTNHIENVHAATNIYWSKFVSDNSLNVNHKAIPDSILIGRTSNTADSINMFGANYISSNEPIRVGSVLNTAYLPAMTNISNPSITSTTTIPPIGVVLDGDIFRRFYHYGLGYPTSSLRPTATVDNVQSTILNEQISVTTVNDLTAGSASGGKYSGIYKLNTLEEPATATIANADKNYITVFNLDRNEAVFFFGLYEWFAPNLHNNERVEDIENSYTGINIPYESKDAGGLLSSFPIPVYPPVALCIEGMKSKITPYTELTQSLDGTYSFGDSLDENNYCEYEVNINFLPTSISYNKRHIASFAQDFTEHDYVISLYRNTILGSDNALTAGFDSSAVNYTVDNSVNPTAGTVTATYGTFAPKSVSNSFFYNEMNTAERQDYINEAAKVMAVGGGGNKLVLRQVTNDIEQITRFTCDFSVGQKTSGRIHIKPRTIKGGSQGWIVKIVDKFSGDIIKNQETGELCIHTVTYSNAGTGFAFEVNTYLGDANDKVTVGSAEFCRATMQIQVEPIAYQNLTGGNTIEFDAIRASNITFGISTVTDEDNIETQGGRNHEFYYANSSFDSDTSNAAILNSYKFSGFNSTTNNFVINGAKSIKKESNNIAENYNNGERVVLAQINVGADGVSQPFYNTFQESSNNSFDELTQIPITYQDLDNIAPVSGNVFNRRQFLPKDLMPRDSRGFFVTTGNINSYDYTDPLRVECSTRFFLHKENSSLLLYADNKSYSQLVNSAFQLKSIKAITCENCFVQGILSTDRVRYYYDATKPDLPSYTPSLVIKLPGNLPNQLEYQISYDIPVLTNSGSNATHNRLRIGFTKNLSPNASNNIVVSAATSGVATANLIKTSDYLYVFCESEGQTTASYVGLLAEIASISVAAVSALEPKILVRKVGNESSQNVGVTIGTNNAAMPAFRAGISIKSVDIENNNALAAIPVDRAYNFGKEIDTSNIPPNVTIQIMIRVLNLEPNTRVKCVVSGSYTGSGTFENTGSSPNGTDMTINCLPVDNVESFMSFSISTDVIPGSANSIMFTVIDAVIISYKVKGYAFDSNISLDLRDDVDLKLNFTCKDYNYLDKTSSDYSKKFKIPATSNNLKALDNVPLLKSENYISDRNNYCEILDNGVSVFTGRINILSSNQDKDILSDITINIQGSNRNWANKLEDIPLKYMNRYMEQHPLHITGEKYLIDIMDAAMKRKDIVLPLVDSGMWGDDGKEAYVAIPNLKAAFNVQTLLIRMFEDILGYQVESRFLRSNVEFTTDFYSDFYGAIPRTYSIAPDIVNLGEDIKQSEVNISLTTKTKSVSWDTVGTILRPDFYNTRNLLPNGAPTKHWSPEWCVLHFHNTNIDFSAQHEEVTFTPTDASGHQTGGNFSRPLFGYSGANETVSEIEVHESAFYDLDSIVLMDIKVGSGNSYSESEYIDDFLDAKEPSKFFITLIPRNGERDENYHDGSVFSGAWGEWMYSSDWSQYKILYPENKSNLSFSLSQKIWLTAGEKYKVCAFWVVKRGVASYTLSDSSTLDSSSFRHRFIIKTCNISLKLTEKVLCVPSTAYSLLSVNVEHSIQFKHIAPNATCLSFVSDITKMFNLVWQTDEKRRLIIVEPATMFYENAFGDTSSFDVTNSGVLDWSSKGSIVSLKKNSILSSVMTYKMKEDDNDNSSNRYKNSLQLGFGNKSTTTVPAESPSLLNLDDEFVLELSIFASMKQDWERFLIQSFTNLEDDYEKRIKIPQIWKDTNQEYFTSNQLKPEPNNSHQWKIGYLEGFKDVVDEEIHDTFNTVPQTGYYFHYGISSQWNFNYGFPEIDKKVALGYPSIVSYSDNNGISPCYLFENAENSGGVANEGSRGFYLEHHAGLINMLRQRDVLVTAKLNLTSEDIRLLDFRKLIRIDDELYILSKIKNYSSENELTEVELMLVTRRGVKENFEAGVLYEDQ